ncbi:hypothetical protein GCM10027442_25830 [Emticicia fontis]
MAFITIGKLKGNLERELLEKLVQSPVADSFKVMQIDYEQAKTKLGKNRIVIKDSKESIEQIGIKNGKSPEEIIEILIK